MYVPRLILSKKLVTLINVCSTSFRFLGIEASSVNIIFVMGITKLSLMDYGF